MKAIQVTAHGGPEVPELIDPPDPAQGRGEVLARVKGRGSGPRNGTLRPVVGRSFRWPRRRGHRKR